MRFVLHMRTIEITALSESAGSASMLAHESSHVLSAMRSLGRTHLAIPDRLTTSAVCLSLQPIYDHLHCVRNHVRDACQR